MQSKKVTEQIQDKALELLQQHPEGLHYSVLRRKIEESNPAFKSNTVHGSIWGLVMAFPEKVYKPSKGLYRLVTFKEQEENELATATPSVPLTSKVKEEDFYAPFADWLVNEIEDATHAVPLGGNVFKDKWGTPDVIGKWESKHSDVVKGQTEIISAEIKTDSNQLITAFGQACAYKLFSHKSYLVIPRQSASEEIDRLDSLCLIFGIGLVIFNATQPNDPSFDCKVRPFRHQPDLYYTNKYVKLIEKKLFP